MARYAVHTLRRHDGLVVDVQADLLRYLDTRLTVPLLPIGNDPPTIARLNPLLEVDGQQYRLGTQFMGTIATKDLGAQVMSFEHVGDTILSAIDLLLTGF